MKTVSTLDEFTAWARSREMHERRVNIVGRFADEVRAACGVTEDSAVVHGEYVYDIATMSMVAWFGVWAAFDLKCRLGDIGAIVDLSDTEDVTRLRADLESAARARGTADAG